MYKTLIYSLAIVLSISACGGGGSSSGSDSSTKTTIQSGTAIDGLLVNSLVCMDVNADSICNKDEPSAKTDENGTFTLLSTTKRGSLLLFGGEDDGTGKAFTGMLTAPMGSKIISPLTTALNSMMKQGTSEKEAQSMLKATYGLDTDVSITQFNPFTEINTDKKEDAKKILAVQTQLQVLVHSSSVAVAAADDSVDTNMTMEDVFDTLVKEFKNERVTFNSLAVENIIKSVAQKRYANNPIAKNASIEVAQSIAVQAVIDADRSRDSILNANATDAIQKLNDAITTVNTTTEDSIKNKLSDELNKEEIAYNKAKAEIDGYIQEAKALVEKASGDLNTTQTLCDYYMRGDSEVIEAQKALISAQQALVDTNITVPNDYNTTQSLAFKTETEAQSLIVTNALKILKAIEAQAVATSRKDAIKLLRQAAFTSNEEAITFIQRNGAVVWINKQLEIVSDLEKLDDEKFGYLESMTRFLHKSDPVTYPETLFSDPFSAYPEKTDSLRLKIFNRSIWWQKALHNEDQLRQRVAYALSQLVVVSREGSGHLSFRGEAAAHYYDILVKHSFGNYGDLLKEVSMNASMADYLTFLGSSKENNITGTAPDENYARELMQLFSVGLYELNDDGTKKLNNGFPIPVYTQDDVSEMAKVFTGWSLSSNHYEIKRNNRYIDTHNYAHSFILPIRSFNGGEFHDAGTKTILGKTIPAGLTPEKDMEAAIDILMANDNIAPHVCRELINRLVTSNPTPSYMSDVVAVFNDNGSGEKGDLKATVEEILTHSEARDLSSPTFGKVDEYMLLTTHYLSSLNVKPLPLFYYLGTEMKDTYWFTPDTQYYHQVPLYSPSVFNFYSPEYIPNDADFSDTGLVAPEFELRTNNGLISFANFISFNLKHDKHGYAQSSDFTNMTAWAKEKEINNGGFAGLYIDTTEIYEQFSIYVDGDKECKFLNLNDNSTANSKIVSLKGEEAIVKLMDYLDNHFTGGVMTQEYKDELKRHLLTSSYGKNVIGSQARNIVESTIRAIIMSPSYMVLK